MQYLLLIYDNEERWSQGYAVAELGEYRAFGKEFAEAIEGGHALQPTRAAATVRVRDGKRLTMDGPFAETKEQLAATTWWRHAIARRPSILPPRFLGRASDRLKCGPS